MKLVRGRDRQTNIVVTRGAKGFVRESESYGIEKKRCEVKRGVSPSLD